MPDAVGAPTYGGEVAVDVVDDFLAGLATSTRATAANVIAAVRKQADLDAAIKWRQLTFAVDSDFDHWICAVALTKQRVNLAFHFGRLLKDDAGRFEESDAKFVRKVGYRSGDDVDDAAIVGMVSQAIAALPRFKQVVRDRG